MGSGTHWDDGETSVLGHSVIRGIVWCGVVWPENRGDR